MNPECAALSVRQALAQDQGLEKILVRGWVRARRDASGFSFLEINDGSCLGNLQALVEENSPAGAALPSARNGAAVAITGALLPSPGRGQRWELRAAELSVLGEAEQSAYPLQKKRHSDEFLRGLAHLRPRTNKYGAALRLRSEAAFALHSFFRGQGFHYVHTPILTGLYCEGAGEMFRVQAGDFFDRPCNLTVSGQLEAEALALALGRVYAFGPTFRAENSNTPRHAAEFWMLEPEAAFFDLEDDMRLAEEMLRFTARHVLEHCGPELELFSRHLDEGLPERTRRLLEGPYPRISYAEAVQILTSSRRSFSFPARFGADLQTEHERFLAEEYFQGPVLVYDYPKEIKAFYMRANPDGRTVAAMDMLVPRVGELIGGSRREERLDKLEQRLEELGRAKEDYQWYLDLRRFGSAPHAGFGLGFERLLMLLSGISNIRDVTAFPRVPGSLEF